MISRKERRIQKALGLGRDIPPTYFEQFKAWGWYNFCVQPQVYWRYFYGEFWQWIAFKLPRKLVYHIAIRLWAHATCCDEAQKLNECVHDTTVDDAIRRWEHSK